MATQHDYQQRPHGHRDAIHNLRNLFTAVTPPRHGSEHSPERGEIAFAEEPFTSRLPAKDAQDSRILPIDIGERLAGLAPMIIALAGTRLELDLTLGFALARIDPTGFDAAILELVENAGKASARRISLRTRLVGARMWILLCDDGIGMQSAAAVRAGNDHSTGDILGEGLSRVHRLVREAHGSLRLRSAPDAGTAIALILPTVLSPVTWRRGPQPNPAHSKSEEVYHAQIRQPVAT